MAAPTLQEVLSKVPALEQEIDSMNEIIPGVPATAANLQTLHKAFLEAQVLYLPFDDAAVDLSVPGRKRHIHVVVLGPLERCPHGYLDRARLAGEIFPCTEDGFFQGLLYAKEAIRRLRGEGVCPDCCNAPGGPIQKRLKLKGLPKCLPCMAKAAVDLRSARP